MKSITRSRKRQPRVAPRIPRLHAQDRHLPRRARAAAAPPHGALQDRAGPGRAQQGPAPPPAGPGKWSIAEIVGHLVDTEYVYGFRLRMALSESGRPVQAYDQAVWTRTLRHQKRSAARMAGDPDDASRHPGGGRVGAARHWKRYGLHPERGKETVRRTLELVAGHDLNHLDQIRAIRKKYGW